MLVSDALLGKDSFRQTVSNNIVYTLSHRTCIRSGVNGNTASDGRGEQNRKRLRRTVLYSMIRPKHECTSNVCAEKVEQCY